MLVNKAVLVEEDGDVSGTLEEASRASFEINMMGHWGCVARGREPTLAG
jgi:hypothetical protein